MVSLSGVCLAHGYLINYIDKLCVFPYAIINVVFINDVFRNCEECHLPLISYIICCVKSLLAYLFENFDHHFD